MNGDTRPATRLDYHARILRVLVHIQQRLDEDLPLDALAEVACFSPYHFHRVFRGMVGEGVKEHVRRLRLERAAHQLRYVEEPILKIALAAGFRSHESFTRAFAAMFGETPSQFRARGPSLNLPDVASGVHYAAEGSDVQFHPTRGEPNMEFKVEQVEPCHVVFVRHVGPYDQVGDAWQRLFSWAGPKGVLGPSLRFFGLCYDDPSITPTGKIRYDACLVVDPHVEGEGEIGAQDVEGGTYVSTIHMGPYEGLANAYDAICGQWLPESGRTLGDAPCMEFYLNDPRCTPPEKLMTKVCMKLAS